MPSSPPLPTAQVPLLPASIGCWLSARAALIGWERLRQRWGRQEHPWDWWKAVVPLSVIGVSECAVIGGGVVFCLL